VDVSEALTAKEIATYVSELIVSVTQRGVHVGSQLNRARISSQKFLHRISSLEQ
jgi:hypothetical protein